MMVKLTRASFLLLLFFLGSCKKNGDQIANVRVDFYIYLTEPSYATLNGVGNSVYVNAGVKGIIIYHKTIDEFAAYDQSCPYDPNVDAALVKVDSTNIFATDKNCGSKFNLLDGSVLNGPSTRPLLQYAADYDGSSTVHVHN
jgi:nitrite reductase/ring-hydroxylating ferredoxin subunit